MSVLLSHNKANKLIKEANKKLQSKWVCIINTNTKQLKEDAAELYSRAAAQYKIIKDFEKAGDCYVKSAEYYLESENEIDAKHCWIESAKCFSNVNYQKSIKSYKSAIQLCLSLNKFRQAAKLQYDIGDLLFENNFIQQSIREYEKSAEYYGVDNHIVPQNKTLKKIADLYAEIQNWNKSIKIYEKIVAASVDNSLLRWTVKDYLFKLILFQICSLCDNDITKDQNEWNNLKKTHAKYCDLSNIYARSREAKTVSNIMTSLCANDINGFIDIIASYDKICKLDSSKMNLIYYIKKYFDDLKYKDPINIIINGYDIEEEEYYNDNNIVNEQADPFNIKLNNKELNNAPDLDNDI